MKTEEETRESIEDLIETLKDDKYPLGFDEILMWMSEIIENEELDKELNKYINDCYKDFELLREMHILVDKIYTNRDKKDGE